MKRFLIPFLLVLTISACNAPVNQPDFPIILGGKVTVNYQNTEITANIESLDDGRMIVSVIAPEELVGIQMTLSDEVEMKYSSLSLTYSAEVLKNCPLARLNEIVEQLNTQNPRFVLNGKNLEADFTFEDSLCKAFFNADNVKVAKIQTENCIFTFYSDEVT